MSKRELLVQLPAGALKQVAEWLAFSHESFQERAGWVKADYVEQIARTIGVGAVAALVDGVRKNSKSCLPVALLVKLFGLPPKDEMLPQGRAELRAIMEELDERGSVGIAWRSLPAYELRDYLKIKLSAREIAQLIGLDLPSEEEERLSGTPKDGQIEQRVVNPVPDEAKVGGRGVLVPVDVVQNLTHASKKQIETLDELRGYLIDELQGDLEVLEDLGDNEQRFQHRIVSVLETRVSREPFTIHEKLHLSDVDQFPDVMIRHGRGNTAIEIKPDGSVNALLADANKLRGYLRVKKTRVTFGVLVYRSPYAIPEVLARTMRGDQLHIVRVHTPRRR